MDGTSMAAPVVSGIAALILSYYPELSASQVKNIIERSAVKINSTIVVKEGDEDRNIQLSDISVSGGIANAYEALLLAQTIKGERKGATLSENKKTKLAK
jgi:subtilisin family serine protease